MRQKFVTHSMAPWARLGATLLVSFVALFCVGGGAPKTPEQVETVIKRYPNGIIKSQTEMVGGKRHGITVFWYDSGCPMSLHRFEHGVLHGPMIKWEDCEDIIALGEYRKGEPWNGFFLVRPSSANPITDIEVPRSNLAYYVTHFTQGHQFTGLTTEMLKQELARDPEYTRLLSSVKKQ